MLDNSGQQKSDKAGDSDHQKQADVQTEESATTSVEITQTQPADQMDIETDNINKDEKLNETLNTEGNLKKGDDDSSEDFSR